MAAPARTSSAASARRNNAGASLLFGRVSPPPAAAVGHFSAEPKASATDSCPWARPRDFTQPRPDTAAPGSTPGMCLAPDPRAAALGGAGDPLHAAAQLCQRRAGGGAGARAPGGREGRRAAAEPDDGRRGVGEREALARLRIDQEAREELHAGVNSLADDISEGTYRKAGPSPWDLAEFDRRVWYNPCSAGAQGAATDGARMQQLGTHMQVQQMQMVMQRMEADMERMRQREEEEDARRAAAVPTPTQTRPVAVFWDYENVRLSGASAATVSDSIRDLAVSEGGRLVSRSLYYDTAKEATAPRSALDQAGWQLIDSPTRGKKEALDKKMLVDMMHFPTTVAGQATIILITGDGDFSYALRKLRDTGHRVIVIYPEGRTSQELRTAADSYVCWDKVAPKQASPNHVDPYQSSPSSEQKTGPSPPSPASPARAKGKKKK